MSAAHKLSEPALDKRYEGNPILRLIAAQLAKDIYNECNTEAEEGFSLFAEEQSGAEQLFD